MPDGEGVIKKAYIEVGMRDEASRPAKELSQNLEKSTIPSFEKLSDNVSKLPLLLKGAFAGGVIGGAIAAFNKVGKAAEEAFDLQLFSERIGVAAERLQELVFLGRNFEIGSADTLGALDRIANARIADIYNILGRLGGDLTGLDQTQQGFVGAEQSAEIFTRILTAIETASERGDDLGFIQSTISSILTNPAFINLARAGEERRTEVIERGREIGVGTGILAGADELVQARAELTASLEILAFNFNQFLIPAVQNATDTINGVFQALRIIRGEQAPLTPEAIDPNISTFGTQNFAASVDAGIVARRTREEQIERASGIEQIDIGNINVNVYNNNRDTTGRLTTGIDERRVRESARQGVQEGIQEMAYKNLGGER